MTAKPYIFLLLFLALISCNKESDNKPTQIDTLDYRDSIVGTYSGSAIFEGMTGTFFYQRTLEVVIDSTNVDGIIIYNDNCYPNGDKYALDTNYTFSALVGSGEFRNDSMYFSCDNPQGIRYNIFYLSFEEELELTKPFSASGFQLNHPSELQFSIATHPSPL